MNTKSTCHISVLDHRNIKIVYKVVRFSLPLSHICFALAFKVNYLLHFVDVACIEDLVKIHAYLSEQGIQLIF